MKTEQLTEKISETRTKHNELKKLSKPLIDWLYENGSPYTTIIIKMDLVEVTDTTTGIPIKIRD